VNGKGRLLQAFSLSEGLRRLGRPQAFEVPSVTGLRALSVLWVIVQHVQQGLRPLAATPEGARFLVHPVLRIGWAGNLGVDVFFVISGYLIGGMLMREREESGGISLRRFYLRRAMRLLPAYGVAIALNLALGAPNAERAWANALFVNNFVPFTRQFMAHTWSLAIEEQFYAVFPVLLLGLYAARPALRTALLAASVVAFALLAVALVQLHGLELSLIRPSAVEFWRYMDLFYVKPYARFGALFIGVLVARLERERSSLVLLERRPVAASLLALVAVATLAFVAFVFPEGRRPDGAKRIAGSFALALDGYAFAAATGYLLLLSRARCWLGRAVARALGARALRPIAQLSYAAYLVHPLCIAPLYARLGFDTSAPGLSYARLVGSALAVSFLAALLLFLFVELPVMRLRPPARA
jgi:peptidoglycan/LPS O-acetylase OafA/YrhL